VIGRKNWLFSDTPKGATASAQPYSLVETANADSQEPYAWLRHALERLPQAAAVEDFEALLPWNCTPQSHTLNGHDPYEYLKDVLERLPTQKMSAIGELLPHKWQSA
jgi:hypothetical protein